ncbi:MAG TPA: tripartite tricarboxylate transporter substrate binding protein [Burkholderiales bacterium]|nr:tripartite tricarboxylate transporter substrate binding protein [Burkholderiales bacterium]
MKRIAEISCLAAAAFAAFAPAALSQPAYPAKTVRIVVPFPPGGTNDIVARLVANDLSKTLGHQFIIDNRGGASGVIGAENVAKSAPDGYTLMVHSASHLTNSFSYKKLPYDTFHDFEPIALLAAQPYALVVHPSLPVKSVKEFIGLAKGKPNQLTYASNGEGGGPHVFMSVFASMANVKMIHVPYKGGGPMSASLMSGETQCAMATIGSMLPVMRVNRVRTLGVAGSRRSTILPDVPTIAEAGLPGYSMDAWIGAFAPAKTPKAIIDRLHDEFNKVLKNPEFAKRMADQGVEPWAATQAEFVAQMKGDYEKYQKVFAIIGTPKN